MNRYFRTLFRALKGESLLTTGEYRESLGRELDRARRLRDLIKSDRDECESAYHAAIAQRDEVVRERDEARSRHETLVAECTRHRHATWEITHK